MEKSPIARAVRTTLLRNSSRLLWIYGVTALASFAIFVVFWCTNVFRDAILSTLELRNGTTAFAWWQRPPVALIYKVYVFNYTNVREFESGSDAKLRVQEVGPYVYRETLNRINVVLHENGTVSYQEKRSFAWDGGKSDEEPVVVPNIPLMSTIAFSRDLNFVARVGLTAVLSTLQTKMFIEVPAGKFLWGYDDNIFRLAKPFIAMKQQVSIDKFGVLALKNGVNRDRITMHTGRGDLRDLGLIDRINGVHKRGVWGDKDCDRIYGTDGSLFPPHLIQDLNATLYVYAKEMCRTLPFRYAGRGRAYGIPTLRYKLPDDAFTSTRNKNECYCSRRSPPRRSYAPHDYEESTYDSNLTCPPAGVFNISACCVGSPLLVSFPHFYLADESVRDQIDGLAPSRERHETYVDLHPRLGIPISGWSRLQLNVELRKARGVPFSGRLNDGTILPLIWIDAGIDNVPDEVLTSLRQAHYSANAVEAGFQWCSLVAVVLSFGMFVAALKRDVRIEPTVVLRETPSRSDKPVE